MSISFNISQVRQIRCLNTWLDIADGEPLEFALKSQDLLLRLDEAFEAYRRGKLPLSEVRKHHKAACDFLAFAAKRYVGLREYGALEG